MKIEIPSIEEIKEVNKRRKRQTVEAIIILCGGISVYVENDPILLPYAPFFLFLGGLVLFLYYGLAAIQKLCTFVYYKIICKNRKPVHLKKDNKYSA